MYPSEQIKRARKNSMNGEKIHGIEIPLMAVNQEEKKVSSSGDPYYVYKEELESKIAAIVSKFEKWKVLMEDVQTEDAPSFLKMTSELNREIQSSERSLKFLEQTVKMVEDRPEQFEHINSVQLQSRRSFLSSAKEQLNGMISTLNSDSVKAKVRKHEQKQLRKLRPFPESAPSEPIQRSNKDFIENEVQRQQMVMQEQDENLEHLGKSVATLGHVAVHINDEIEMQNKMLDDLNDDLDETQERMNFVMGKMSKLLKTKDRCQLGSIIILTFVLFLMVFLVIYT